MKFSRRSMIGGAAGVAAAAGLTATMLDKPHNSGNRQEFYGEHQAGILSPAQPAATFISYRVTATGGAQLKDLLRTITQRAALLMSSYTPEPLGISAPPSDSGVLGLPVPADNVSITLGLGESVFDKRFGLENRKPKYLTRMGSFANDDLKPEWCHGDIMLQICANNLDAVLHAARDINRNTRGGMQILWKQDGFINPPRPEGTPRNHFGFKDGTSNPQVADPKIAKNILWADATEQPWAHGGTYQVVRLIRMLTEFWDRISISEQENIFGRNRDTGAPLDGSKESDVPDFLNDPLGKATPLNSHMRMANPRDPEEENSRILRRAYNYSRGTSPNGNLDMGLIFCCFQQNIARQFEAIQLRLKDEPLVDYITPYGGGYFFVPPAARNPKEFIAEKLFP